MFKCIKCKNSCKGIMNRIVVEKRPRVYAYVMFKKEKTKDKIILADQQITTEKTEELKDRRYKEIKRWKTEGWEIVREEKRCNNCREE